MPTNKHVLDFFKEPRVDGTLNWRSSHPPESITLELLQTQLNYVIDFNSPDKEKGSKRVASMPFMPNSLNGWLPANLSVANGFVIREITDNAGWGLRANRKFQKNKRVALISVLPHAPNIHSWCGEHLISMKKPFSCGPPTNECMGVLMNAAAPGEDPNCRFGQMDCKNRRMPIITIQAVKKGDWLRLGRYLRGSMEAMPQVVTTRPYSQGCLTSCQRKVLLQKRGAGGKFCKST